jgi:hypothetical protein
VKKKILGQYYTVEDFWLKTQIQQFIKEVNPEIVFDPFAGEGHLLNVLKKMGFEKIKGFDIDKSLDWDINDSLKQVPKIEKSLIITNPPYLSNYSAKRKKIYGDVSCYFESSDHDDLYKIALDKMLQKNKYVIAIIPETFINSNYPKNRLKHITILEENPFNDTDKPVCIACFDDKEKQLSEINVFKNEKFISNLGELESLRLTPNNDLKLKFNDKKGKLALRAIDGTNPNKKITFLKTENLNYDLNKIKNTSRLITVINLNENLTQNEIENLIEISNEFLNELRDKTGDVILSAFKGNNKAGKRRRRLDYKTARAILEKSYHKLKKGWFCEKGGINK